MELSQVNKELILIRDRTLEMLKNSEKDRPENIKSACVFFVEKLDDLIKNISLNELKTTKEKQFLDKLRQDFIKELGDDKTIS